MNGRGRKYAFHGVRATSHSSRLNDLGVCERDSRDTIYAALESFSVKRGDTALQVGSRHHPSGYRASRADRFAGEIRSDANANADSKPPEDKRMRIGRRIAFIEPAGGGFLQRVVP